MSDVLSTLPSGGPVPEPVAQLARQKLTALLSDPGFLELMGEDAKPGEFCAVVQDLVRRLSLDPKAPGPIAKKPYSLSAEDMESLERSIDEDFRLELGSVEKVTPAAGDLIGIPLAGGDFALAVLLTAECIGPSPGFPEFWGGVLAIADVMKSQVGEPNDLDPTALRIVKATGAMLGPMRLGEWPVLRAGVNLAGPTFALGLDPFHALRNLRWSERDRRTSQQLA